MMTAEWKMMKKNWSNLDILAEAARIFYEREQRAEREKSKKTVSEEEEEEENDKRFSYIFPRKSKSWVRIARRNPQNPFQNLNGASTSTSTSSSSLLDLNLIPCHFETNYLQFPWHSPYSPSNPGDYTIAADSETENPPNPNFHSSPYKSRKRRAVQQRKPTGGLKKAKVVPFSWVGKETPEWLVTVMRDMNVAAGDAKLIFEKVLSSTDVNPAQSRLLLPFNQLHRNDFLTPDESSYIRGQGGNNGGEKPGVKAVVVNQNSETWSVNFKMWEMKNNKDSGKGSLNYALNYGWNKIVKANGLKEEHNISLWSFRCQDVLYFALVRP